MKREQLEKLAKNPHFKLSRKQLAQLEAFRNEETKVSTQQVTEVVTQEIRPSDKNVISPIVKRSDNRPSRTENE